MNNNSYEVILHPLAGCRERESMKVKLPFPPQENHVVTVNDQAYQITTIFIQTVKADEDHHETSLVECNVREWN